MNECCSCCFRMQVKKKWEVSLKTFEKKITKNLFSIFEDQEKNLSSITTNNFWKIIYRLCGDTTTANFFFILACHRKIVSLYTDDIVLSKMVFLFFFSLERIFFQ